MHDKEKKESVPVGKKVCKHNRQGRCMQCERELAKTEKLRQEGWENYQLAYKRVQELEEELAKLREFVTYVLQEGSWQGCDIDGGDAQDKAEQLGLIELRPIKEEDSIDGETEHYFTKWTK